MLAMSYVAKDKKCRCTTGEYRYSAPPMAVYGVRVKTPSIDGKANVADNVWWGHLGYEAD